MRVSLTRDFVKKIPIPKRPIDYRDTRLKGLILRAMPSGVKSWYCEYARAKRVWLGRVDAVGYSEAFEAAQTILSNPTAGSTRLKHASRKPNCQNSLTSSTVTTEGGLEPINVPTRRSRPVEDRL